MQVYIMLNRLRLKLVVLGIVLAHLIFVLPESVLAQSDDTAGNVKGNVVNSKYVTIIDHRYQHGNISDIITGTVRNNSTQQIPMISVIAVLYDKDNNLITTGIGSADTQDLMRGGNSTFSIFFIVRENVVDHYTLFSGGIPQLPDI